MFPTDMKDLITAFVLLIMLVVGTSLYQFVYEQDSVLKEIEMRDGSDLFLLNYLKTENANGEVISEIIIDAEEDDVIFGDLLMETIDIMNFAKVSKYNIIITYPTSEKVLGDGFFEDYDEIRLFSKSREPILVKIGVEFMVE